ncbi:MAG: hypothetical protein QGI68_07810 [Pseudomonadales bacterium]|jgi:hypothetical protein|nr:hypothetical protein [Pseudomonadales bacterium]MDP7595459.1 hypothetical protein [Pseudomonadales bacterium]HJN52411.1 hypothetical protein [Pseudomonadales bacterium]|tara:strand:- start:832 stop:1101 length:270 start_codon:yes stop_codon:yes gene_type:complete
MRRHEGAIFAVFLFDYIQPSPQGGFGVGISMLLLIKDSKTEKGPRRDNTAQATVSDYWDPLDASHDGPQRDPCFISALPMAAKTAKRMV